MVEDDLAYNALKKEFDRLRGLLDEERSKVTQLSEQLVNQEKGFEDKLDSLIDADSSTEKDDIIIRSAQDEKIKALSRHLGKEHSLRLDAQDQKNKLGEDYQKQLSQAKQDFERQIKEKEGEVTSLRKQVSEKDELIRDEKDKVKHFEDRELHSILSMDDDSGGGELMGEEDSSWITETQDFVKILHRFGSIKLEEASQTMDVPEETVRAYAKILDEKELIVVDDLDAPNPTIRATRDLVERVNDMKTKMRRRGRLS